MYRRSKQARLLTGGLIGISSDATLGDEHWDDVTLLLNGESATIADVSSASTALTNLGSVPQNTSVYKYGSGSLRFTHTTDNDANAGISYTGPTLSGDYTVEFWWRPDVLPTTTNTDDELLWDCRAGATTYPLIYTYYNGTAAAPIVEFYAESGPRIQSTATLTASTWYHVAVVRSSGTYTMYIDGVSQGTWANSSTINSTTHYIGRRYAIHSSNYYGLNGYIDDFRLTPGVARYTQNFKPPVRSLPAQPLGLTVPVAGDDFWDDVVLLLDGTDPATDLSTQQQTVTEKGSSTGFSNETDPFGSTQDVFDFNRAEASGSGYQVSSSPITFGSSPFTIEMWIKLDSASLTSTQLLYSDRSAGTTCVTFRVEGQKLTFFKDNSAGGKFSAATTLAADTWYHVALTYDSSTVRLFLDGQLDGSSSQSLTFNPNVAPVLGYDRAFPETTYQLDGRMAQVRVTKGVARYTADFTPPTASFLTNAPTTTTTGRRGGGSVPTTLAVDTFATLDPTTAISGTTLSNGNLTVDHGASNVRVMSNQAITTGKYYFESRADATDLMLSGVIDASANRLCGLWRDGNIYPENTAYGSSFIGTTNVIVGCAIDADTGTVWFSVDGVWQNSATLAGIGAGTDTNYANTGLTGPFYFGVDDGSGGDNGTETTHNFGQDATFNGTESAGAYTDANGLGEFQYEPPAGFVGLYTTTEVVPTVPTLRTRGYIGAAPGSTGDIQYLIVAGGGGGGFTATNAFEAGGGGGAGGMLTGTTAYTGAFEITVGAKGLAGGASHPSRTHATDGGDSVALGLTAVGGGHGGYSAAGESSNKHGSPGGSGGGGFGFVGAATGGAGTSGQGNNGGACGTGNSMGGGGGGGAGGVGGAGSLNVKGAAGAGASSSITGSAVTYAQGGQGGLDASGGAGSTTKGGGGGGSGDGTFQGGSDGQDGVVILRMSSALELFKVFGTNSVPTPVSISGTDDHYYEFSTAGDVTVAAVEVGGGTGGILTLYDRFITPSPLAGLSADNPAASPIEVASLHKTSGVYWINPNVTGWNTARRCWVDVDRNGGGWALWIAKYGAASMETRSYFSAYSDATYDLSERTDPSTTGHQSYMWAILNGSTELWWVNNISGQSSSSAGSYVTSVLHVEENGTAMNSDVDYWNMDTLGTSCLSSSRRYDYTVTSTDSGWYNDHSTLVHTCSGWGHQGNQYVGNFTANGDDNGGYAPRSRLFGNGPSGYYAHGNAYDGDDLNFNGTSTFRDVQISSHSSDSNQVWLRW